MKVRRLPPKQDRECLILSEQLARLETLLSTWMQVGQDALQCVQRTRNSLNPKPAAPGAVIRWTVGPDGGATYVSEGWLDLTGQTFEQMKNAGWLSMVHPEDAPKFLQLFRERKAYTIDYRVRSRYGHYLWMRSHGAPHFGPDGALLGYSGSCGVIQPYITRTSQVRRRIDVGRTQGRIASAS